MFEALKDYHQKNHMRKIVDLFDQDRAAEFSLEAGDLFLDYSKVNVSQVGRALLLALAKNRGVQEKRDAMFAGEKINTTEGRAVLHTALRAPKDAIIKVNGENVVPEVHKVLAQMGTFAEGLRAGSIKGSTGKPFRHVVNIGIGGSDLGPVMATRALSPYHDGPKTHFVSNIDPAHIADVLAPLDPEETLILIASKTFTTIETMTNAKVALEWLSRLPDPSSHLAAISTALDKTSAFGIAPERVFGFEDWVGGRYSMWGPIGLSIMIAIGQANFEAFLAGARTIDQHFCESVNDQNMPLMLGLIGIYHRNICGYATRAVLPYEERLARLPAYLQQLDMESNGKSVDMAGNACAETGPVVWGEPGTNGQHAFYQLIHQGTSVIPCEFLLAKHCHEPHLASQHDLLKANCLAQSRALLIGRSLEEAREIVRKKGYSGDEAERQAKHRVFAANRPSTTLIYPKLTPNILGQIVALYEHRVFVEGAIWGINSFDQWGVELGKELALALEPAFSGERIAELDPSTDLLLRRLQ